jgi:hypothetical protein
MTILYLTTTFDDQDSLEQANLTLVQFVMDEYDNYDANKHDHLRRLAVNYLYICLDSELEMSDASEEVVARCDELREDTACAFEDE